MVGASARHRVPDGHLPVPSHDRHDLVGHDLSPGEVAGRGEGVEGLVLVEGHGEGLAVGVGPAVVRHGGCGGVGGGQCDLYRRPVLRTDDHELRFRRPRGQDVLLTDGVHRKRHEAVGGVHLLVDAVHRDLLRRRHLDPPVLDSCTGAPDVICYLDLLDVSSTHGGHLGETGVKKGRGDRNGGRRVRCGGDEQLDVVRGTGNLVLHKTQNEIFTHIIPTYKNIGMCIE